MRCLLAIIIVVVMAMTTGAVLAGTLDVPLTVREWAGASRASEPVTSGVPFRPGVVTDVSRLALFDSKGNRLPAQFVALARWRDGSVRWLLCDFQASVEAKGEAVYTLAEAAGPAPATPLRLESSDDQYMVTTGPLRFVVKKNSFDLLHQVWIDRDEDGKFGEGELMAGSGPNTGLVLLGPGGEGRFTSGHGTVTEAAVEYEGPVRVALRIRGTLCDARGAASGLTYTARIEAFANQSYVRTTVTLGNPNAGGRYRDMESNYWGLGAEGNQLFREFALVETLGLDDYPYVEFGEKGRLRLERLPLVDQAYVYQDSSGGENWYHRTHMNRNLRIPLRFRGYEIVHDGTQAVRDDRFDGWLDLADIRWGCAVGLRDFWQNFPGALAARHDGTLSVALWPSFAKDDHELIAGEQKTREVVWYFRAHPPHARQVMHIASHPLQAWAPAEHYLGTGEFGRHVPFDPAHFSRFERMAAGAVLSPARNFTTDRETVDEYGWRNYGDTWAANEHDQTGGPRQGERVVSHFNLEYDEGWGMLLHAIRSVDAHPELAQGWWDYGRAALLHEADIDIHHSTAEAGENRPWAGGKFTHTSHGVEAERSGHASFVSPHLFGTLRWSWGLGGGPESGHWNDRGIMLAYYLTGNRRFLDCAEEIVKVTAWKIEANAYPQTEVPDRAAGHSIQILTDHYLLTWDERYARAIDQAIEGAPFEKSEWAKQLPEELTFWQLAIYLRAIGRYLDVATLAHGSPPPRALASFLGYARAMAHAAASHQGRGWERPGAWASDALMMAARYTDSEAERRQLLKLAEEAFDTECERIIGDQPGYYYHNAKTTAMSFTGGGEWMYYRLHSKDWLKPGLPVAAGRK